MEPVQDAVAARPRRWRLLAIAGTVAVLVLCFLPGDAAPDAHVAHVDKVLHALAFGAVAYAWRRAGLRSLHTIFLLLLLAIVTEGGQALFTVDRSGDVVDLAADMVGVLAGLLLARLGRKA